MQTEHGLYRIGNYLYTLDEINQTAKIRKMKEDARKAQIASEDGSIRVYAYKDDTTYCIYSFTEDEVEEDFLDDFLLDRIRKFSNEKNHTFEIILKKAKSGQLLRSYFIREKFVDCIDYNPF